MCAGKLRHLAAFPFALQTIKEELIMKVIVMSGISGSGKSTYIGNMVSAHNAFVASSDSFFMNEDKYIFDSKKIGEAHAHCFRSFIEAMIAKRPLIVVDNTNTTIEEISPYMLGAAAFGYEAEVITMRVSLEDMEKCEKRNVHKVPTAVLKQQRNRLNSRLLPLYWKNTDVNARFGAEGSSKGKKGIVEL
jgi:predicted kinase